MANNNLMNSNAVTGGSMQTVIMITISGDMFLFNNILSDEECTALQTIANLETFRKTLDFSSGSNACSQFISAVKEDLGISLEQVKVSHVVRVK